uniref:Uncharacterized protein n=1 Tax=Anopheles culicifacies TaxID=139723 RepID=A0A182MC15_9DIPT
MRTLTSSFRSSCAITSPVFSRPLYVRNTFWPGFSFTSAIVRKPRPISSVSRNSRASPSRATSFMLSNSTVYRAGVVSPGRKVPPLPAAPLRPGSFCWSVAVLTNSILPEYQIPSVPGAQTRVPTIERFARRLPVDILLRNFSQTHNH